jgi:exoribonuclease-2
VNVFFEEDGGFKVGHVMSDIGTSLQIESMSGKRSKIKANSVLLRFESELDQFLPAAQALATEIEADFLWEVCGKEEFGCEELAREYFGHKLRQSKPLLLRSSCTARRCIFTSAARVDIRARLKRI